MCTKPKKPEHEEDKIRQVSSRGATRRETHTRMHEKHYARQEPKLKKILTNVLRARGPSICGFLSRCRQAATRGRATRREEVAWTYRQHMPAGSSLNVSDQIRRGEAREEDLKRFRDAGLVGVEVDGLRWTWSGWDRADAIENLWIHRSKLCKNLDNRRS